MTRSGIRHLAGLYGTLPSAARERARDAVAMLVGDAVATAEEPGLVLAAGPAEQLDGLSDSAICIAAGPLYDAPELAANLGLPSVPTPDSLIHAAFGRWGESALGNLTSEAAVLMWNRPEARGFLARDPLGASSVFWCRQGSVLAFATELRILLALLQRRPATDVTGIAHWLRREASRPDITLYEGVSQLGPGYRLRLEANRASVEQYWRPTFEPPERLSMEEAVARLRPVFLRSVERRLAEAGGTGVLLSGGLDSTSVAGAAEALHAEVRGYSNVFPDRPEIDESSWIDGMAAATKMPVARTSRKPPGCCSTPESSSSVGMRRRTAGTSGCRRCTVRPPTTGSA